MHKIKLNIFSCVFLNLVLAMLFSTNALGFEEVDDSAIQIEFEKRGVEGTFVLYDLGSDSYIIYNSERAERQYRPASTFKIANTLIGLHVGIVSSVDEIIPYGGKPQHQKSWESDMGLRDAIKISNLPVYQELARRIGLVRMQNAIDYLSYGNREIGNKVDSFWLEGPLEISALEQVKFIKQLVQSTLPIKKMTQQTVREILLLDDKSDCQLYGKTGWGNATQPGVGWWVGWVISEKRTSIFALNIDIHTEQDGSKRKAIGKRVLSKAGIWPC